MVRRLSLSKSSFIIASLFVLLACGGSDTDVPVPQTVLSILVNAGQNISVNEEMSVTLSGSASGGEGALVYAWSSNPNINILHEDTSVARASLTTPKVIETTNYELTLTVTDGAGNNATDKITLTVNPVNSAPISVITVSQVEPYQTNRYPVNSSITLSGSASSDSDPTDNSLPELTYDWQQTSGESLLNDTNTSLESIVITTPDNEMDTQAQFQLSVTDQDGAVDSSQVTLYFLARSKTIPSLSLLPIPSVNVGERINLYASPTSTVASALPFTVNWQDDFQGQLVYEDKTQAATYAIAPDVDVATIINFSVEATDSFGNSVTDNKSAAVYPLVSEYINDTGVFLDANGDTNTVLYQENYPGQDSHKGRDSMAASGLLPKAGDGQEAFDFTWLDENGEELNGSDTVGSCVRDNVTGLIWQTKMPSSSLSEHSTNSRFTWYELANNGGFSGYENGASLSCNLASQLCNTSEYVSQTNQNGLCGFFDWRLPTPDELLSLVHYGLSSGPLIDRTFFPNMQQEAGLLSQYWTSQASADGVTEAGAQNAWIIDFDTGTDLIMRKDHELSVLLVRAGRVQQ